MTLIQDFRCELACVESAGWGGALPGGGITRPSGESHCGVFWLAILGPADDFDGSGIGGAAVIDFVSASFSDDGVSKTHHFRITFSAGHATKVVKVTGGI